MAIDPVMKATQAVLASITGLPVIFGGQQGYRQVPPFIAIRMLSDRVAAQSTRWSGTRSGTIGVQIFGVDHWQTTQQIMAGLEEQSKQDALDGYLVTLSCDGSAKHLIPDADGVVGNRVLLDLTYNAKWELEEPETGTIEYMEGTATYD